MNKQLAFFLCLIVVTMPLSGCFGGSDSNSDGGSTSENLDDWQVHLAASESDLPECNDKTNGRLYYVESDAGFQVCKSSGWEVIDVSASPLQDEPLIYINAVESSLCPAGGKTFEIGYDLDDDGRIQPSEITFTMDICDGTHGQDGTNGADGADGENGIHALVATSTESPGPNCANGGLKLDVGVDLDRNGVLSNDEKTQIQYVCDGGSSNQTLLTTVTETAPEMGCITGKIVSYGLDNGDMGGTYANGVLESGEIDTITTYCSHYILEQVHGIGFSSPAYVFDDIVYFTADDGEHGKELWRSDGSRIGTYMLKDINSGQGGSVQYGSHWPIEYQGELYFGANDGELWKTDGTYDGTTLVADIGSNVYLETVFDGKLFFSASGFASGSADGVEIWTYDGTTHELFYDINYGYDDSNPHGFNVIGDKMYFIADDGSGTFLNDALWITDGTEAGTYKLKDTNDGEGGMPYVVGAVGNAVLFTSYSSEYGRELWTTDGTVSGTQLLKDITPGLSYKGPDWFCTYANKVYFSADDGTNGFELWVTDGTSSGTTMVADINSGAGDSNPMTLTVFDNLMFFTANDGVHGKELWVSDGTAAGTTIVKDINVGLGDGFDSRLVLEFFEFENELIFRATDGVHGQELWVSDGTSSGTQMIVDSSPGNDSWDMWTFFQLGDSMFLSLGHESYTGIADLMRLGIETVVHVE